MRVFKTILAVLLLVAISIALIGLVMSNENPSMQIFFASCFLFFMSIGVFEVDKI
jgi:hypothetical protein